MRKRYKGLREFLGAYQAAIDSEDPKAIMKVKRKIDEVHEIVESNNTKKYGSTSIAIGTGFFSVAIPVPKIAHRFGIRAALQKIIFQKRGESTLKKLLSMFDMTNAALSEDVYGYFKR